MASLRGSRTRRHRRRATAARKPRPTKNTLHVPILAALVVILICCSILVRGTVLPSHHNDLLFPDRHHPDHPVHNHPAIPRRPKAPSHPADPDPARVPVVARVPAPADQHPPDRAAHVASLARNAPDAPPLAAPADRRAVLAGDAPLHADEQLVQQHLPPAPDSDRPPADAPPAPVRADAVADAPAHPDPASHRPAPADSKPVAVHVHSPPSNLTSSSSSSSTVNNHQPPSSAAAEIVAADGTVFNIGHDSFHISPVGRTERLHVANMNTRPHDQHASIAFFMQISEANLAFLPRLLVVMWHPDNLYVLHLDIKIPPEKTHSVIRTVRDNPNFSNVHFLQQEPITYKGVSMLLNTLSAIEFLMAFPRWDYFINLSGSDYPLVNVGSMRQILGRPEIMGRNVTFLQLATDKAFWQQMKESRFNFVYYDTAIGMKQMQHELKETWVPHPIMNDVGIQFVQAEAWIIAHRSFAEFAARSAFARKLLLLLSTMQDPEEHFFGMLAWNNPVFNKTLAHHAFRGIYWEFNGTMSGQHPYYVDQQREDGTFPFWESRIVNSRCFFARKFKDPTSALLDRIDRLMSGTHANPSVEAVSKSLMHVQRFVSCVADLDQITDQIRAYSACWYPS